MPDEELTANPQPEQDDTEERKGLVWLPWLVLLIVLLLVAWLLWRNWDWKTPQDSGVAVIKAGKVVVPDVVGMTEREARAAIEKAGLVPETEISYDVVAPAGSIVSQQPKGGSRVESGAFVVVQVATDVDLGVGGPGAGTDASGPEAPDLMGLTEDEAITTGNRGGYQVSVSESYSDTAAQGVVFMQDPAPGDPAEPGTVINVTISLGKKSAKLVTVPNVLGLTQAQATSKIEAAGLEVRPMLQPLDGAPVNKVYEQQPAAGERLQSGGLVFILVIVAR